jgi:hypothetical protein
MLVVRYTYEPRSSLVPGLRILPRDYARGHCLTWDFLHASELGARLLQLSLRTRVSEADQVGHLRRPRSFTYRKDYSRTLSVFSCELARNRTATWKPALSRLLRAACFPRPFTAGTSTSWWPPCARSSPLGGSPASPPGCRKRRRGQRPVTG